MTGTSVRKGQNVELPEDLSTCTAAITWTAESGEAQPDLSVLLLGSSGRVASDDDLVFYNQPLSPDGTVRLLGSGGAAEQPELGVSIDLDELRSEVVTVALVASLDIGTFASLRAPSLVLRRTDGTELVRYDVDGTADESALHFGEVYRRAGRWRFRAVGQGWADGLAGIVSDFGVSLTNPDEADPAPSHAPGHATPLGSTTSSVTAEPSEPRLVDLPPDDASEATDLVGVAGGPPAAADSAAPNERTDGAAGSRRSNIRTRKVQTRAAVPVLRLAGGETWQSARLFSISGVGSPAEQEKRATSALLAIMMAVRPFGRGLTARMGAPAGPVEGYLEVPFALGERTVIPDGVLRVARRGEVWTALVEVKTGPSALRRDQVESYLDVARNQGFAAVVTISNDIPPAAGVHPVEVDQRKLKKVRLHHLSWTEVLHEARMVLTHGSIADPLTAWTLNELIRYLTHPRSGAATFQDMGPSWVAVRDGVLAGTLRASDRRTGHVVDSWSRLVRHLCLELTADLGATVRLVLPRRLANDPVLRSQADAEGLAGGGLLTARLRVPETAGTMTVTADLRTSQVRISAGVRAPAEGTAQRRIGWLLRQIPDAPEGLLVECAFGGGQESTCELLQQVRARPAVLVPDRGAELSDFTVTHVAQLGTKRSGVRGAFIPSVLDAVETFYRLVLQPIRPWAPAAPPLPAGALTGADAASVPDTEQQDH